MFLKGCPLRCLWCCNPEAQKKRPQLFYVASLCEMTCGRCVTACPRGAIEALPDGSKSIQWAECDACGQCVPLCPTDALAITGRLMTAGEVVERVRKDSVLYRNSGGGVTLSGGEPTAQPEFAEEILKGCHDLMLHTAIETCGYASWDVFERLLPHVDLVLYDIKHLDPARHKELTGVGNERILENAERIVATGKPLIVRAPMIPGCNDSEENLKALGKFVRRLRVTEMNVLPYHQLGRQKFDGVGLKYELAHLKGFAKERVAEIGATLESIVGDRCSVKVV